MIMLKVKRSGRLCVVVDSLISAAKVRERQNSLCHCYVDVYSLSADRTLEKAFLNSGKLNLGLISAGSNDIEP